MFEEIKKLIESHDTIVLHRHANPDGDAIGSQVGLATLIEDNYPDKRVYVVGDPTTRYDFVDGYRLDEVADEVYPAALAIVLDSATAELVSDKRFASSHATARIDHHIFCEQFCQEEVVDTSYESCAGMIAAFALEAGWNVSLKAASAVYTGIVTDSGRFRYDSTSPRTLRLAAAMLEKGVDTNELYRCLYAQDLDGLRLKAYFSRKITTYEDSPVAYIYTTADELDELGITDVFSISRGMVGVMSDLKGVDIWVNFTENRAEGKVWVELRSSRYNINPIAVKYGGGGHQKASGADVADYQEAMAMLADLKRLTENQHD